MSSGGEEGKKKKKRRRVITWFPAPGRLFDLDHLWDPHVSQKRGKRGRKKKSCVAGGASGQPEAHLAVGHSPPALTQRSRAAKRKKRERGRAPSTYTVRRSIPLPISSQRIAPKGGEKEKRKGRGGDRCGNGLTAPSGRNGVERLPGIPFCHPLTNLGGKVQGEGKKEKGRGHETSKTSPLGTVSNSANFIRLL